MLGYLVYLGLVLGAIWGIKEARGSEEVSLVLAPALLVPVFWFVALRSQADWAVIAYFGYLLLATIATFALGHHIRGKHMREALRESDED